MALTRALCALLGVVLFLTVWGPAQATDAALDAYRAGDHAAALRLWRTRAEAGDPLAALKLGQMRDLGLGAPRDPQAALDWYRRAGEAGLAEAQFNAAVMLDAAGDPGQAAFWYGRAAAQGHARAQYNLALLLEAGAGVPANPRLAAAWFEKAAATLPAAAGRAMPPAPSDPSAPPAILVGASLHRSDAAARLELVWAAAPDPAARPFIIEVLALDAEAAGARLSQRWTALSALSLDLPPQTTRVAWRVGRAEGQALALATPWRVVTAATQTPPQAPQVVVQVSRGDAAGLALAQRLIAALDGDGAATRLERVARPIPVSSVASGAARDQALAEAIATFMPVLTPADVRDNPTSDTGVVVRIGGDAGGGDGPRLAMDVAR